MQALTIALLCITGLIALFFCFLGSRYFRAVFTLAAFFCGLVAAYCLAGIFFSTLFAKIAVILAGGLVLALVFNQLQFLGRFLTGIFGCLCVGAVLAVIFNISLSPYFWDAVFAVCLIVGFLSAANQPLIFRIASAVFGAFIFSLIVFYLFTRGVADADFASVQSFLQAVSAVLSSNIYSIIGATAFLSLAGAFVQFFLVLRKPAKGAAARPSYMLLTPPLLEDPDAKQTVAGRYTGRHIKLDS